MVSRAIVSGDPVPVSPATVSARCCESGKARSVVVARLREGFDPSIAQSSGPDVEASERTAGSGASTTAGATTCGCGVALAGFAAVGLGRAGAALVGCAAIGCGDGPTVAG